LMEPDGRFLQKPFNPDVLARTIRDVLDGKGTPATRPSAAYRSL
jgi:hypothetical protein